MQEKANTFRNKEAGACQEVGFGEADVSDSFVILRRAKCHTQSARIFPEQDCQAIALPRQPPRPSRHRPTKASQRVPPFGIPFCFEEVVIATQSSGRPLRTCAESSRWEAQRGTLRPPEASPPPARRCAGARSRLGLGILRAGFGLGLIDMQHVFREPLHQHVKHRHH